MSDASVSSGFLDVFVIRSFRESHLDGVIETIGHFVREWGSPYWSGVDKKATPFRLRDTDSRLASGEWLLSEIGKGIANAAICIVILDGMRPNVLFELGFLRALGRPYIILKHRRFGPTFSEITSNVSDLNGMVVKEYDHEQTDAFEKLLKSEFSRCDGELAHGLGTHLIIHRTGESGVNLVDDNAGWRPRAGEKARRVKEGLEMDSDGVYELDLNRHTSPQSIFIVRANLQDKCSTLTAYLRGHFRKADKEVAVWFGYASQTVAPYGDYRNDESPVEITIPISVSGPGEFHLIDNLWRMAADRLKSDSIGPLRVSMIRLWAKTGPTSVSEVRIAE
jgi:hypothetical protein